MKVSHIDRLTFAQLKTCSITTTMHFYRTHTCTHIIASYPILAVISVLLSLLRVLVLSHNVLAILCTIYALAFGCLYVGCSNNLDLIMYKYNTNLIQLSLISAH